MSPSGEPSWVLLHIHAHIGEKRHNATTAVGRTRNGEKIFVSFFPERPPLSSNLYVDCPDGTLRDPPCVLYMADDLILFHAYIGSRYSNPGLRDYDYFIYRADPARPSVKLLPHPQNLFRKIHEVGILPHGGDHYTIAALVPSGNSFILHLLDSDTNVWTSKMLHVESPQKEFPIEIPGYTRNRMVRHATTCVITLGRSGTMGWVDLWRGIIFCDILRHKHTLRGVPVPLPMKYITAVDQEYQVLGHARYVRGIAFINGRLKFVELEFDMVFFPGISDEETRWCACQMESWTITTWTNTKMSGSYEDWHKDCTLRASDISVSESSELPEQRALQNLFVSEPTFDEASDGDVVYLTARMKVLNPKSWVLAIDMRNHRLQSVVTSGPLPPDMPRIDANYSPCSISTTPVSGGTYDAEESSGLGVN